MHIRRLGLDDVDEVLRAAHLFDAPPRRTWAEAFFARDGHHLHVAYDDGAAAGFVSGVEVLHPDKGVEMLLYELGVDEPFRRRGIARALIAGLLEVAEVRGCTGMWVPVDHDNEVARATYVACGADEPEDVVIFSWELGRPGDEDVGATR